MVKTKKNKSIGLIKDPFIFLGLPEGGWATGKKDGRERGRECEERTPSLDTQGRQEQDSGGNPASMFNQGN